MADSDFVDHLAEVLAGIAPDLADSVLDALADVVSELGALNHDDVVTLVKAAVTAAAGGAAGTAMKHRFDSRDGDLETAIRRALATP